MSDNDSPDDPEGGKLDPDDERHAADDPTAVWDADTLRAAGLEDVLDRPETDPPPAATTPATKGRDSGPSMVAEGAVRAPDQPKRERPDATPREPHQVPRPTPKPPSRTVAPSSGELGWGATIALAVGLAVAVYFLVRFLR